MRLYHFKLHPTSSHVIHMYLSTFCCYEWGHMYACSQQHFHMLQGGLCLSHGAMLYFQMLKRVQRQRIGDTLMICCQHVGQYVAHNTLSAFFWRQCLSYQKNNYDMLAHGVAQRDDKRVACQEATQLPAAGTRV